MKYLKKFNESLNHSKAEYDQFYRIYMKIFTAEEEDEYSNTDLLSLIGDLLNEYDMDNDDIEYILLNYDTSFDVNGFLKTFLEESDSTKSSLQEAMDEFYEECRSRGYIDANTYGVIIMLIEHLQNKNLLPKDKINL